jgi:hypothetical protein
MSTLGGLAKQTLPYRAAIGGNVSSTLGSDSIRATVRLTNIPL